MSTEIFAGGSKPNAIAAMLPRIKTFYVTDSQGNRTLDREAMVAWLNEQFANVSGAQPPTVAELRAFADRLAGLTDPAAMRSREGWPTAAGLAPDAVAASVRAAKSETQGLSEAVTNHFAWLKNPSDSSKLSSLVDGFLNGEKVFDGIPKGVQRILDDRFYIATYVTDWDEESAPSQPSEYLQVDQNDIVKVIVPPVFNRPDIVGWRLYRSNVGSVNAAFQLVEDREAPNAVLDPDGHFRFFNINNREYNDNRRGSQLQEPCPTLTWLPPPSNLRGLIGMPNGVMAGFYDNTVCFCESFVPYAWPVEYQITTEYPIVGLGVFGQTLVVCHRGGVDYIHGADAASMSAQKNISLQACVSPRSIVSAEGAVAFASPDGLCVASSNGVQVLTETHYTRDDWQKLNPTSMIGAYHEGTYYFTTAQGTHAIHLKTGKLTTVDASGSAFFVDRLTDRLYTVVGNSIRALFSSESQFRSGTWRSKKFVMVRPESLAWLSVESDFIAPVTVRWFGDGVLRHQVTVNSRSPVRLPPGRYLEHEIEAVSSTRWNSITIASTTDELQKT